MIRHVSRALSAATLAAAAVATGLGAQQPRRAAKTSPFDRTVIPTPGPKPQLRIPSWTTSTLNDGAQLIVSEKTDLPLVWFQINFVGGADQYEPANETGLATFVANMLTEGTMHRTGDQIANDLQLLGTSLGSQIIAESGRLYFVSTRDKFAPTLAILADVLENPTFPQTALDRLRARSLVALTQSRDRTSGIANVVFPKVVYGAEHPYGRSPSEASLKAITRDDLVSFYKAYYTPGHAIITVTGDVSSADVKRTLDDALGGWARGGAMPSFNYPPVPAAHATTIYLVDKPGAAQSTFVIGEAGPSHATPDYFALRVMNEMLGVLFQSRLNHDIREVKGYSYGVGSNFAFGRGPGAFRALGDIVTAKSDSALIEFIKQLRDIRGPVPPTDDEMAQAKASLVQSMPESFSSVEGIDQSISSIYTQGLPRDYFQEYMRAIGAVTKDDVVRVAQKYIDPEHLAIVIVGDRSKIEGPLEATKIAPIVLLDPQGNPVQTKTTP